MQMEPSLNELQLIRHSVLCNSVSRHQHSLKEDQVDNRLSAISAGICQYLEANFTQVQFVYFLLVFDI